MKSIINGNNVLYIVAAVAITAVALFFVVPQLVSLSTSFGAESAEACCGEGPSPSPEPVPGPGFPPAVCDSFTASRTTVPDGGANVTLSWQTTNATRVTINQGVGRVPVDGSRSVFVDETTNFTLTAAGIGGLDTCTVRITEQPPVQKPAVCDSFTASRTSVPHGGANVTLSWNTTNATSVSINNGVGTVGADGSRTVFVDDTTTFTLTAVGAGGNDTCTVTIKVAAPLAPSCDFLSANRTSLPEGGGNVTLSWGTTNADDVSINNGIGDVADDGSRSVFVNDDTTFTLTANGAGGSDTCTVHIDVEEDVDEPEPRCDFFTVSDDEVEEGDEVTLSWGTTNADDVEINQGIGDVSDDGSRRVEIDDDITFILEARANGLEDTCSVRVEVEEEEDDDDDEPRPRCELSISDKKVKKGDEVTLEWEARDADEVEIEDDRGKTIFRDRSISDNADGDVEVEITRDTEFTLIVEGDGGRRECEVEVEVEEKDAVVVLTERETPRVAGISLTQVPYTGFEAGPTVTFLFYALVTLWAFGVAYMLVIRKDSVLGFSLPTSGRDAAGVIHEDRVVAAAAYTPSTVSVPANLPTADTVVGYGSLYENETAVAEEVTEADETLSAIEEHAHAHRILLSSDALRYVESHLVAENGIAGLDLLIGAAKAAYPSEDGWVVLNLARVQELVASDDEPVADVAADTLAAAIVRGDVVAAYGLLENRPMVALAAAAAELDAAYRARTTGSAVADDVATLVAQYSNETLKAAIDALTSALDGTYTDEASAVKVAVMKAINVFN